MENYLEVAASRYPQELIELVMFLHQLQSETISFSKSNTDGRINSVEDENTIIKLLVEKYGSSIIVPPPRSWCDFIYQTGNTKYYINIKCSTGTTDNAFNKKALVFSLTDLAPEKIIDSMNFTKMISLIDENMKNERDIESEYFYLYVDKKDGTVFIKSLLDIQNLVSNPTNKLQINWKKEKMDMAKLNDIDISSAKKKILTCLATSLRSYFNDIQGFLIATNNLG